MIKKILIGIMCLCLVFGINTAAENVENSSNTETPPIQMQREERNGEHENRGESPPERNGEMGRPPQGEPPQDEPKDMMTGSETGSEMKEQPNEERKQEQPGEQNENTSEIPMGNGQDANSDGNGETNRQDEHFRGEHGRNADENMPMNFQDVQNEKETSQNKVAGFVKTYSTPLTAMILLAAAFVFVVLYKRKKY